MRYPIRGTNLLRDERVEKDISTFPNTRKQRRRKKVWTTSLLTFLLMSTGFRRTRQFIAHYRTWSHDHIYRLSIALVWCTRKLVPVLFFVVRPRTWGKMIQCCPSC